MVSSLIYSKDGIFNISLLEKISQFPLRKHFESLTNEYQNIHEIKKNWISAQEIINLNNKINFFKTHNSNCKIDNYVFTNKLNTAATIYVVRDPRNVVTSISNHFTLNIDTAKNFLNSPSILGVDKNKSEKQNKIITLLGSWKDHYISWTLNNKNLLLVKYENLLINPKKELERIITFLKNYIDFEFNNEKISNIVETTSFNNLKKIEKEGNFTENAFNKIENSKVNFFNLGKDNKWENLLDAKIENEIKKKFYKEMKELNYI
tara:strand:+ start:282 stop:1070 length:789 start_codon:yes stop_codon:yes gene_type:complete